MIAYTMLGTGDPVRAKAFYDPLMALLGAAPNGYSSENRIWYSVGDAPPMLVIGTPYEGEASPGNGNMVAVAVADRGKVGEVHAKALQLGGADEGAPGLRTAPFYGAYFRDPDGNKLCVFTMSSR